MPSKFLKNPNFKHAIYKYEGSGGKIYSQTCNNSEIYFPDTLSYATFEGSVPSKIREINQNKDLESK